jgi:hypothetical protein
MKQDDLGKQFDLATKIISVLIVILISVAVFTNI